MNTYEWRILTQLRENRGKTFTAYQIANNGPSSQNPPKGKTNDHSFSVEMAQRTLDRLASEGYILKRSRKDGTSKSLIYSAR